MEKVADSTPLFIQDVIELLTNIKLKHGNVPVYVNHGFTNYLILQDEIHGITYVQDPPSVVIRVET
jgi:hypothetical protein